MANEKTRAELVALLESKVLSGGRQTTALKLRDVFNPIITSLINLLDDKDAINGYLGIDEDGKVDPSFIKSLTPADLFLMDDGTFSLSSNKAKVYSSPAAVDTMDGALYSQFIFSGGTPATWDSMAAQGGRVYRITNIGTATLTINYPAGANHIIHLASSVTPTNTIALLTRVTKIIIDDGTNLIFI